MLYWIAVTKRHPKKKDEEEKLEKLLIEPFVVVAKDEKSAATKATLKEAEMLKKEESDLLQIHVSPF